MIRRNAAGTVLICGLTLALGLLTAQVTPAQTPARAKAPQAKKAPAATAAPLQYELRFDQPNTHLLDITIHASGLRGGAVEFALPAWAPGAYFINNYARLVQEFRALGPGEKPLLWRKSDKQTWRIELAGNTRVTVRYKLYANRLGNNRAQYNDRHAHLGGPSVWMYLVGGKERPIELRIEPPPGWRVATGMRAAGENAFTAQDYDWLADSPIEVGTFTEKTFEVAGTTYHFVVDDLMGQKDYSRVAGDTQRIVGAVVPMYAGVADKERAAPFAEYWFLMHIWPQSGGGLEHLNSTQINFSTDWDASSPAGRYGTDYDLKLFVIAHEFYHAWNVKRLRPRPLGPFDYSREVHTPSLWISEGLTSYYGQLVLVHAGLVTPEAYLDSIGKLITEFESQPGRKERSIEDTSWDTWFDGAASADTNLANTTHSYYDGGQILGHLLDFAIREATGNRKSLDDWMRLLYSRHALPKPGFLPEEAVRAASEVGGRDMSEFFRRYISGKEVPPYETYFAHAGIRVEKKTDTETAWLGATLARGESGWPSIAQMVPGGPAQAAGLDRGDLIMGVDGKATAFADFLKLLGTKKPGDSLQLRVRHLNSISEITVQLGHNPNPTYTLKLMENPGDLQKRIYESWIRGAAPAASALR
jgi:predicted metalloprotease with PDZ domain